MPLLLLLRVTAGFGQVPINPLLVADGREFVWVGIKPDIEVILSLQDTSLTEMLCSKQQQTI